MPDDIVAYWQALKGALDGIKTVTEIFRNTKDLIPDGEEKAQIEQALEIANTSAEQATALLAVQLDFKLCKCEFPGTPMTFVKHDPTTGQEIVRCPKCGTEYPPTLQPLDPYQGFAP